MAWAKLHTDILGDPKLMRAAKRGLKGLEFLPWLIAFAKQADDDGRLSVGGEPAEPADLVRQVPGATRKNVMDCLKSLEKIGVLSRETDGISAKSVSFLRFSAWEHRSGTKPSDSSTAILERVRRHRKQANASKADAAQGDSENAHAESVTPSNALRNADCNATEKIREDKRREEKNRDTIAPAFLLAWSMYPRRAGSNPRRSAERAWGARVREGVPEPDMFAGTERYRAFCEATEIVGSVFVMQGTRFYGPNREFESAWDAPPQASKAGDQLALVAAEQDGLLRAGEALLARRGVS